jgi:hypothetical protein
MKTVIKNSAQALCLQPETLRTNPLNRPSAIISGDQESPKTPFFKAFQSVSKEKYATLPSPSRYS